MALSPIDAICPHCSAEFTATPKRSFLGFQKFRCPRCRHPVVYPLTRGYRVTYWVLFGVMVISIVAAYSRGEFAVPGGFGIAVAIALIYDWRMKSRLTALVPTKSDVTPVTPTATSAAMSGDSFVPPSAMLEAPSEENWRQALVEFEGPARRGGLWGRSYAEANGDEAVAKAKYLRIRASEFALAEAEAEREAVRAAEAQRMAQEQAARLAAQREHDARPKGLCPSCEQIILLDAAECPRCRAMFGPDAAWHVSPLRGET